MRIVHTAHPTSKHYYQLRYQPETDRMYIIKLLRYLEANKASIYFNFN
jgi:hypothetical protein